MNPFATSEHPQPPGLTSWCWYSRWPVWAQIGPIVLMLLSGSTLMGSYRWVQSIVGVVWMSWFVLEVNIDRTNPRHRAWSRTRRIIVTGLGMLAIAYMLISGIFAFR
ncbi:MAG: hypothetical protein QOK48_535 [Blastocatellia bacterium]|nr:hypothetical protein [Blastocatellia bacterium]